MGLRSWDKERGIIVFPYVRKDVEGNWKASPNRPAFEDRRGTIDENSTLYEQYLMVLESKDGDLFLNLIKYVIVEQLDGVEGDYLIVGYNAEPKKGKQGIPTLSVLKLRIEGGYINVDGTRTPYTPRGKYKSTSYKYLALEHFEGLSDYVG